jgi:hypothetical protein
MTRTREHHRTGTAQPVTDSEARNRTHVLSWIGCITGVAGAGVLAAHMPWSGWGFVCFLISNMAWYAHGRITRIHAQAVMQVGDSVTAAIGIWNWLT